MDENEKIPAAKVDEVQEEKTGNEVNSGKAKNRGWKIAGKVLAVLAILLVLGVCFRDILIENSVRHVGTLVTGTEVKIDSFKSSLGGSVELKNIKVANPAGYQKPYAFEIDRVYVKIDPSTLLSQEPVVEVVEVTGVRIDMEMKGASKSNLTDIKNNIEKFAGSSKSGEKKAEKEEESDEPSSDAPAPLLKKIDLTSMSISFSSSTLKSSVPVPLAPIYLRNVGGKGEPLGESIMEIFDSLMSAVNGVGGVVLGGVEVVGDAGKALGDGVSKGAKNIGDSISGIFK